MSSLRLMALAALAAGALAISGVQAEAKLLGAEPSCGCEAVVEACAPKCCYNPCIKYRQARPCKKVCCGCSTSVETVLTVQDPRKCGCAVEVPVCLPSCLCGEPCVTSRCGVLGRAVVTYKWSNGYKLTVTFTKHNDVLVTYFGK